MNSSSLQPTGRLAASAIISPIPRTSDISPKRNARFGRTVALSVVATLVLVVNGLVASPAAAGQSPDSFSIETFPVGSTPLGLAFDGTNIWVTDWIGDALIKVRASDGVILGTYGIFEPHHVACDGTSVWVTNQLGKVTKFRGSDGTIEATISLGTSALEGIIFDGTSIWVANSAVDWVAKLRVSDG